MLKQLKNSYCCIGLMSGTSLDGLDVVLCQLTNTDKQWSYKLLQTHTYQYDNTWKNTLKNAPILSGIDLLKLHRSYGMWLANRVTNFIKTTNTQPYFIASHGHTVFHEPDKKLNFQLGDGAVIAAQTGLTTISDFRSLDICFGGQGAPLVPIGDYLLFDQYAACVNLGGFANISAQIDGIRKAWDICPLNFVINRLMSKLGETMDENGNYGKKGKVINTLLHQLNNLPYYKSLAPKSLAQEWVDQNFFPILTTFNAYPLQDIIRTCYEHFADTIIQDLHKVPKGKVLFTGGGTYNTFLLEVIRGKTNHSIVIPSAELIDFKEALIFALLGALRLSDQINCLSSVTGAEKNSCSGSIYWGKK